MSIVRFTDVWEMFKIKFSGEKRSYWEKYWALRGINFSVAEGEVLGIIGENGSGKTTILKLAAGILRPDRGSVEVKGKAAGLLELGAGFQPELTGRENVLICAGMHGYSGESADKKLKEVGDFARIGDFMNAPVKNYSQGMFVRLAFSFAVSLEPDVLLIDDSLAVGDSDFQKSCIDKILALKESGRTIIFVTHDSYLLNKIATRALLLKNGRIVEDSHPERVGALYALVCGSPEGKAALESGNLKIVFNNGVLFFFWNGISITSEKGVTAYLSCAGEWYASSAGEWRITGGGAGKIEAEGVFPEKGISLKWLIEIGEDHCLQWDIYAYSRKRSDSVSGCRLEICFDGLYREWFTNISTGRLGAVSVNPERKAASDRIRYAAVKACISGEESSASIPEVVVEPRSESSDADSLEILDGSDNSGRMMLRCAHEPLSSASEWLSPGTYFSGKIFFRLPAVPAQPLSPDGEREMLAGDSKFVFRKGELLVFTGGKPLTSSRHICGEFYGDRQIYDSRDACWKVRKTGPERMVACGSWPGAAFRQVWEISLENDGTLRLRIWMVCFSSVVFSRQRLQVMCPAAYSSYFSAFGSGEFPARFFTEEYDVLQRCLPCGETGVFDNNGRLPSLSLAFEEEENNFAKILNSDLFNRSRILRVEKVEPEPGRVFAPGKHSSFSVSLRALPPKSDMAVKAELSSGKTTLFFLGGRFEILHEGKVLSSSMGIYTSFRCAGRWHDSVSKAVWKVEKSGGGALVCSAQWRQLPIKQLWRVCPSGKGRFGFDISLIALEKIDLERRQFNLALNEKYGNWSHQTGGGVFGVFLRDTGDDWHTLGSVSGGAQSISASGRENGLPEVKLSANEIKEGWRLEAVNSDLCHRARVLRMSSFENVTLVPGETAFFSGEVTVE